MRRMLFILLLILQSCFLTIYAQVNDLVFQQLTRSNGLPVEGVNCLAQDSSGFIWIGTKEGLFRYDGFNFKAFYASRANPKTIPSNEILKIYVTRSGLLWVASFGGGAALLNSNGEVLKNINSFTCPLFTVESNLANDIKEDKKGNIWITTASGLFLVSPDGELVKRFDQNIPKEQNMIRDFVFDAEENLWLGTLTGITVFDTKKMQFKSEVDFLSCCSEVKNHNRLIHTLGFYDNELWYSSWLPDLIFYDTLKNIKTVIYSGEKMQRPDFDRMATTFYKDSRNSFWIATMSGLYFRQGGDKKITTVYRHEAGNPNSLINDHVNAILEDRDGNFWIATNKGISITRPYGQWIKNFSINNKKLYPFGDKYVNDIIEIDSNRLLVGTYLSDGLYLTDKDFRVKKHLSFGTQHDWVWTHYTDEMRKQVYISTQAGMLRYDIRRNELLIDNTDIFKNRDPVSRFVPVSDSLVWLSHFRNSFGKWNPVTGEYKEYDIRNYGLPGLNLLIEKDNENKLWLLPSGASPFLFDDKTEKIVERFEMNGTVQGLHQNGIYFLKDLGEYFLFGYELKGLTLYSKRTKTYEHFSKPNGLPTDAIKDAVVGNDNTVWIASRNGIIHFNPLSKSFKSYGFEDGILNNEFEFITRLKDGRIVAGSRNGLISFDPREAENLNKPPTTPVFTAIDVYGKSVFSDSGFDGKQFVYVPYNKNYFSIEFISLQYNSSRKLEYAFMLEGLDDDWIYAGERRSVTYSKLKGGNYYFRVKARTPGGEWVEAKKSLHIVIQTPFYQQWWFYVLCAALLVAIIYGIFRYRLQQLLKIEKMRTAISSDLHDEIGSSLSSISIFSQMAMKNIPANSKEEGYLQRIGTRSRESIEKMSDIVWSINPDNDNLEQILVRMKNYSTEITEAKEIIIQWNETGSLSHSKLSMEQRKNFYLLFKEVINNAVKHSGAKNILISLATDGNKISLVVKDDGTGFDINESTTGNGLKNIRRRCSLLRGTIKIDSRKDAGTSTELIFFIN